MIHKINDLKMTLAMIEKISSDEKIFNDRKLQCTFEKFIALPVVITSLMLLLHILTLIFDKKFKINSCQFFKTIILA